MGIQAPAVAPVKEDRQDHRGTGTAVRVGSGEVCPHHAALLLVSRAGTSSDDTGTLAATAIRHAMSGPGSRTTPSHALTVVLDTPRAAARSRSLICARSRAWRIAAARARDGS